MTNKIVLASANAGKLKEMQAVLADLNLSLHSQQEFNIKSVEETGLTFVENALLKARHASKVTSLPVIADDSGLIVPALNGEPGLYSSRYAGENASDEENVKFLLKKLENESARSAYFYSLIVLLKHEFDPAPIICEGRWCGVIAESPVGEYGFGYDPIFYLPELEATAAQLPADEKNRRSHRAQALLELKKLLQ